MPGSIRIGRLAGIDIFIHVSWFIILILLTVSLATTWFPDTYRGASSSTYLILGLIAALLLFVSVLLHELAHSLVARHRGLPVKNITLFIFGGVSNIEREPESAGVEFQMAFVGPLVSLLIGGLSYLLLLPIARSGSPLAPLLAYLAVSNILLGLFNLLPGFPLDGGRVLRSIIWRVTGNPLTATRTVTFIGQLIAYLFMLAGIWLFFSRQSLQGIWLGFIGWFLFSAAQAARMQATFGTTFRNVLVGQAMKPATMVPANISLQGLIDEYILPLGLRSIFIAQQEQLAGLITLSDIRHTPRGQWARTPVGTVMKPAEQLQKVSPQQLLTDALQLMTRHTINQVPVVEDGRLVGVLNREAIFQSLSIRQELGLDQASTK